MVRHRRTRPSRKILVDPIFRIPPGAEEVLGYSRTFDFIEDDNADDSVTADFVDDSSESDPSGLSTPTDFSIVSQSIRRTPGGAVFVDIVIDVEDIDGATNYEIQATKG